MSDSDFSLADVRLLVDGKPAGITLDFLLAQDHESRLKAVQKGVDCACNLLEQHKNKKQEMGEDQITLQICEILVGMNFQAIHDASVGGHCDISIRAKEQFLWLAEAKVHDNYAWLDKGFKQLSTRYSTGVKGQDNGDVLIYCYTKDALAMLKKWRAELISRYDDIKTDISVIDDDLAFLSTHIHESSGRDFCTRHKAISLHWAPQDK